MAGTWKITNGSVVGYRVKEVLFGQNHTAVGRTSAITGHVTISGTTVTAAGFTVQMATIKSDESERDVQFRGRIMDTSAYPTGTLTLTKPIALGALPAAGVVKTYTATADLTLHGHTRPVTFPLSAERTSGEIEVSGSIPVLFSRLGHPEPELHRLRDHPEPRRARIPAEARPLLTCLRAGGGAVGVAAPGRAGRGAGSGLGRRTAAHGS